METAKISSKSQITLPNTVRKALHVQPGDRVLFEVGESAVVLRAMGPSSAKSLAGSLQRYARMGKPPAAARGAIKKEIARAAAQEG